MAEKIGFVFDLDGTFINSTDIGDIVKRELYKEFNIQTNDKIEKEIEDLTYEIIAGDNHKKLGTKLMWAIFKKLGLTFWQRLKALKRANSIFKEEIPKVKLFEGSEELIGFFDENENHYDYAIITTSSDKEVDARLKKFPEFYRKFEGKIVSRNSVKNLKPHPDSITKVSSILGIPFNRIVLCGDMHTDILLGKNVEATTIGVLTGIFSRQKLLELEPDFIFDSIADILDNIEKIKEKVINN